MFLIMEIIIDTIVFCKPFRQLRFDSFDSTEVWGFVRGLAMGWDLGKVKVIIIEKRFQFMLAKVTQMDGKDWFFSLTYDSPCENGKKEL